MTTILITGAAGNLGGILARSLASDDNYRLHLMTHHKDVDPELRSCPRVTVYKSDLANPQTLIEPTKGVDVIVHFAGVLFQHHPEKFLPVTNTAYFNNLLEAAKINHVKRIILVSFPHVEGETTPQQPASGRLDGNPVSVHALTRLEEEKSLFQQCEETGIEAVSYRLGMVYGRGILMPDAARWFAKRGLLGVWKKPTYIHLISIDDYISSLTNAISKPGIQGIYHIGDDGIQTLQEFLDACAVQWKAVKPWRMPVWMIMTAASIFETFSGLFSVKSPLTRDFIRIGMVSYYGDTSRMKKELLPSLKYRNFKEGIQTI